MKPFSDHHVNQTQLTVVHPVQKGDIFLAISKEKAEKVHLMCIRTGCLRKGRKKNRNTEKNLYSFCR